MYFYQTEKTDIELIKQKIEKYANILITNNHIEIICDKCGKKRAEYYVEYFWIYWYHDKDYVSDRYVEENQCYTCLEETNIKHKVKNGKKLYK